MRMGARSALNCEEARLRATSPALRATLYLDPLPVTRAGKMEGGGRLTRPEGYDPVGEIGPASYSVSHTQVWTVFQDRGQHAASLHVQGKKVRQSSRFNQLRSDRW